MSSAGSRMSVKKQLSRRLLTVLALALALGLQSWSAVAEKNPSKVRDLAYGSVLYAYFQQDYFTALSELLVADEQGSIVNDRRQSDLLRGGIYLSYGMDSEAEKLFKEVIASGGDSGLGKSTGKSRENLARAWFYLGKLRYKKGDYSVARENFARVNDELTDGLVPEYAFLSDSASFREAGSAGFEGADSAIDGFVPKVARSSSWGYYRDYNDLLNQLALLPEDETGEQNRIADEMTAIAQRVGNSEEVVNVEELLSFRDQVYTSAGFLFLRAGNAERAMKSFKRVRSDSVLVGQALLGYGWAAASIEEYEKALAPWQQLAQHSMIDPTTHEALLAVPFVYEQLGADSAALAEYDNSVRALQGELQLLNSIDDYLANMPEGKLSDYYGSEATRWLDVTSLEIDENSARFAEEILHNRLLDLLSQGHFSYLEQQRQDVQWLIQQLDRWVLELEAIHYVVDAREQRRQQAVSAEEMDKAARQLVQLRSRREALQQRLAAAEDRQLHGHYQQLMTAEEYKILARIEHAEATLEQVADSTSQLGSDEATPALQDLALQKKQLQWARGLLLWQVQQDSAQRQWELERLVRDVDQAIANAEAERTSLLALVDKRDMKVQELAQAEELVARIVDQRERAEQMASRIDVKIVALLRDDVDKLRQRATIYLAQSSMSRARLLDSISEREETRTVADVGGQP